MFSGVCVLSAGNVPNFYFTVHMCTRRSYCIIIINNVYVHWENIYRIIYTNYKFINVIYIYVIFYYVFYIQLYNYI